ncbi:hypothetical protein BOTBODRAFT_68391 [Botryobasidium botryosum FD-172 SS1]|uniref:Aminoglycoside phosphotransferase domain-containing protein n=1 Tax=Botryobasidium botryosum (strain FD-172 SS1) TaxID=930990 RepID=A0A067M5K5_BOTB1|nr:hypothetical protein BOTBODRAFT_68391 [Botryobasidium botryosum FD-172 SS1]
MPVSDFGFLANDNLPSRDEIVTLCWQVRKDARGIPLCKEPGGPIMAWVKFGADVTIAEALTQGWVAKALDADPEATVRAPRVYDAFMTPTPILPTGHIVMEYVDAPDCKGSDFKVVAKAMEWLIRLKAPSSAPGPVGGGPAVHVFFYDWASYITYNTVEELEDHVNGILALKGDTRRVNFVDESSDGLYLCPCDINSGNFKKCEDGKIIALDFGATCFLPPSFLAFVLVKPGNNFARNVAQYLTCPPSDNVAAMKSASYYLVPYGTSEIGQLTSLSFYPV